MSTRPTRRARQQKRVIVDSDSDSDELPRKRTPTADPDDDASDTYTPAPAPTPRRASRRVASTPSATGSPAPSRARRTKAASVEPSASSAETTPKPKAAPRAPRGRKPKAATKASKAPEKAPEIVEEEEEDAMEDVATLAPPASSAYDRETTPQPRLSPTKTLLVSPRHPGTPGSEARNFVGGVPPTPLRRPPPSPSHASVLKDTTDLMEVQSTLPGSQQPQTQQSQSSATQDPIVIKSRQNAIFEEAQEPDGAPKPRLVITHLVLMNFKSYAGRQEVGPFHASFSSVVGPNGSGKSNVIDSLLFVFGFRASKMRQGKISALIHNSAAFPNLEYCEVEVHFQQVIDLPNGGHEVVPDSVLVVSRRAFKNNSSTYYINGRTSNYKEVTTLLRGRGIDLDHKRFLILQGEVESIAQMKPKAQTESDDGLLEYLEDIIGTSTYKQPIEEAATQVEEMNEVCAEKNTRVQHVEKEKNGLEDKKNIALEYIKNENELAIKKSALYQIYIAEADKNITVGQEMLLQLQTEMDADSDNHRGAEEVIKKLQKKYQRGSKEAEEVEQAYKAIQREVSRQEKETVKFQEKEKFLAQKQKKLQKSIQANRLSASEAVSLMKRYTSDVERYTNEVTGLTERLEVEEQELESIRESLKEKTAPYSNQITIKQGSLEPFNTKINDKQQQVAVTKSELELLHEKANASQRAREEVEARITMISESQATKEVELKECKKERAKLEKQAKEIEQELSRMAAKEPEIRDRLSGARQKADEAKASLSASRSQGNVLTGLMRLKESGRIEGFHGRLGNLGTIDARYDIAISTACPQLDNMVVDTVEAGQQCIDYLRKNNVGRANFICLDRLQQRNLAPINTPENAPRLFDLIKPKDARFAPAFYSVCKDTLVATDLQQANRIAYGERRWRVVTLDGGLIDISGTMSGGGTSVSKGRMSSKLAASTSKEAVAKLEVDRDTLEQQYAAFQEQQRGLENELRDLNVRIPQLGVTISKIELEIKSATQHMADAERRLKELEKESGSGSTSSADLKQMKALEKKISILEAEIAEVEAAKENIEDEIKALQDKILEIGGMKLRGQKAKVDSIKEQLETVNEQMSASDLALTKAAKQKTKSGNALAKEESELESIAEELEHLQVDLKEHQKAAEESREKAEEAQGYMETKNDELAEIKNELERVTDELNKTRAARIEMENRMEEYQKSLKDNQRKNQHWQNELGKLSLQNISDLDPDAVSGDGPPAHNAVPKVKKEKHSRKSRKRVVEDGDEDGEEGEDDIEDSENEAAEDGEKEEKDEDSDVEMGNTSTLTAYHPSATTLPMYSPDELADLSKSSLTAEIALLEETLANTNIDLSVLADYRRRAQEHAARLSDLQTSIQARDALQTHLNTLRSKRLSEFLTGFNTISLRLKEMYQMITMGGNAELELVDSLDPFSEGILFSVMPPKKSWKNISNLSGGEKTLSSLALVFALHHYKPTPLYVMDEIDAALDFRNVSIVASYIKERTKNAQFIVISLRNNMFELAARLVGVYKVNHMTKSVTIENKDYLRHGQANADGKGKSAGPPPTPSRARTISQSQAQPAS